MATKRKAAAVPKTNAKYDKKTAIQLLERIQKEVDNYDFSSRYPFVPHLLEVLDKEGFRDPLGKKLTERGVRYQAYKAGIRFREQKQGLNEGEVTHAPANKHAKVYTPAPQMAESNPDIVKAILTNDTLSPEQRIGMLKSFYGVK